MENLLRTPSSSSMCGVTLQIGETYVLNGRIVSGQALISSCGLSIRWADTTSRQRKGLRQLYEQGCVCDVSIGSFYPWDFKLIISHIHFLILKKVPYICHNFSNMIFSQVRMKNFKFFKILLKIMLFIISQFVRCFKDISVYFSWQ